MGVFYVWDGWYVSPSFENSAIASVVNAYSLGMLLGILFFRGVGVLGQKTKDVKGPDVDACCEASLCKDGGAEASQGKPSRSSCHF